MTKAEIRQRIEELKKEIVETKKEVDYFDSMQLALKLVLNGSYGAFANAHFVCSDLAIAGTITAMGRDIIKYMDTCNENYWYNMWHLDTELHAILGIENVKRIEPHYIDPHGKIHEEPEKELIDKMIDPVKGIPYLKRLNPVSIYCDTDSLFVGFEPAMKSCDWEGDGKKFVMEINKHRIVGHFDECLERYAAQFKVKNIQDFKIERINESIIFLEKKRYVQNVVWEDGIDYMPLSYLYPKGIELVKSSTPPFAREQSKEIIKYFLANPDGISAPELIKKVREIKNLFKVAKIEDISMTSSCNGYSKFVIDDQNGIDVQLGTPYVVKAAALHNYLLNQNGQYKAKYSTLKGGSKVKFYYCTDTRNAVFAYMRGLYPYEFAPPMDIDLQFEKTILNTINTFTKVLDLPVLNSRLTYSISLF